MLRALTIRDFVIVDRLDLEFAPGFTALTGETGAGKSILIDALTLLLGERGEAALVREGCARAELSAEFDLDNVPAARDWLREAELADENGQCLLRRVLEVNGRSRAFINGRPSTLQQVKELGELLVDIHGQHEHQSLMRPALQRELLDRYGESTQLAQSVADAWRAWQERRRQRENWERDAEAIEAERERLQWQRTELEGLEFSVSEWDALQADHRRLANAASLREAVEAGLDVLSEAEGAVLGNLDATIQRLDHAREFDAGLAETLEVLEPARIQVQEAVYALRRYRDRVDLDPQRLREIEQRLEAVHTAARKYRVAPEQLPHVLERARQRLAELGGAEGIDELIRVEQAAHETYVDLASELSARRAQAAARLGEQVTQLMQGLAMSGGRFQVQIAALAQEAVHGMEAVEFMVAANPGTPLRALAKVASGGELSRISLAIQVSTTAYSRVPTLVFDEVDAGIGGRIAEIVGGMLAQLGAQHQVMCITHLPQVAAAATHQWQVSKAGGSDGTVRSQVRALGPDERVEEIARMLGGVRITETTRRHAAEMLGEKT